MTQSDTDYGNPMATAEAISKEVADGNIGAWRVVQELMYFTKWFDMMLCLKRHGMVGSKLWELYKDKHKEDRFALGEEIKGIMRYDDSMKRREDIHGGFYDEL